MDDKGNIYSPKQIEEMQQRLGQAAEGLVPIPGSDLPRVKRMNRKARRAWYAQQSKKQRKAARAARAAQAVPKVSATGVSATDRDWREADGNPPSAAELEAILEAHRKAGTL